MRSQLGFGRHEDTAAVNGQAANFKDEKRGCDSRVGMDGCGGVHGVASLCGGRVRQISTNG